MDARSWTAVGELGVDAATCAMWDGSILHDSFQLRAADDPPTLPSAFVATVGDDIDGLIHILQGPDNDQVVGVRIDFVDDVAGVPGPWSGVGTVELPTGNLVLADPYCSPTAPYRRRLQVRPGRWVAEERYDRGDLQAVRIIWREPMR